MQFPYNIEEDSKDVQEAVYSAKYGDWDTVFSKLKKKPFLVNCIPEGRSWGILHQAVYWNDIEAVRKILNNKACDALIKTKKCRAGEVGPSSTAVDIVETLGSSERIKSMIKDNIARDRKARFSSHLTHVVSRKNGEQNIAKLPLFIREIVLYKNTLLHDKDIGPDDHLVDLLKRIFDNEIYEWRSIEHMLHQSLYGFDKAAAEEINGAQTRYDFFREVIKLYTGNRVYRETNKALKREFPPKYKPTAEDLALGLFALLLDLVLAFWKSLDSANFKTYRGVSGKDGTYKKDNEIMFNGFVSTSKDKDTAEFFTGGYGTVFEFDNSEETRSRPKSIKAYSQLEGEDEYIYAIGAEFRVTHVQETSAYRYVYLKLLKECVLCQ